MLEFGPFCLDLGHIAWIWAILQNLGLNRPQRRQSPEDGPGGGTDGQTDSPSVLQDFVPFRAAAQKAMDKVTRFDTTSSASVSRFVGL